ncbi:unnamed protein product [Owenia fusiformis]|uniref:Uncharacterized protein n=1 Tax=Owenia fusiformis TaxID=6347 RepID=A0A8J1U4C2_OWEFU|nr:unnamed protein product [Owenia fusiformis]
MFLRICIFSCIILGALSIPVVWKDCGSKTGGIKSVDVTPCGAQPCVLKHNSNVTMKVQFVANAMSKTLTSVVHGIIAGVPVPFPIPNPDGCKSNVTCPVKSGDMNTYSNVLFVNPSYPKLKLVVKWELKDDSTNDMFCFVIPVSIGD